MDSPSMDHRGTERCDDEFFECKQTHGAIEGFIQDPVRGTGTCTLPPHFRRGWTRLTERMQINYLQPRLACEVVKGQWLLIKYFINLFVRMDPFGKNKNG